jgi:hypothetical protein
MGHTQARSWIVIACTSRGSNPDQRRLRPLLSPIKVLVPWPDGAPGGFSPEIPFDRVLDRVRYVELTGYHNFDAITNRLSRAKNVVIAWSPRTEQHKAKTVK